MDREFLTPQQVAALSSEERENYIRARVEEMVEPDSEDETTLYWLPPAEGQELVGIEPVPIDEDLDAEQPQLPEYIPEDIESDDDNEEAEEYENMSTGQSKEYKARDGTLWTESFPPPRRNLAHTVFKSASPGPTSKTLGLSIIETFRVLTTEAICDIIIRESNRKGSESYKAWNRATPTREHRVWQPITASEFDAYLGILLFAGVSRSNYEHTHDLWKASGHPLYRASMGRDRFYLINRFIRFDNGGSRQQRLLTDKAAAISDIWSMLNRNLQESFVPGANITVDEQLYPYRGGTRFTQYIPSKPAKYGIKV